MTTSNRRFETHKDSLAIYNQHKTAADPTYRNPIYLAKAMIAHGLGEFTTEGRTKFTRDDVIKYISYLEQERKRRAVQERRSSPIYGISPEYKAYLRGA